MRGRSKRELEKGKMGKKVKNERGRRKHLKKEVKAIREEVETECVYTQEEKRKEERVELKTMVGRQKRTEEIKRKLIEELKGSQVRVGRVGRLERLE